MIHAYRWWVSYKTQTCSSYVSEASAIKAWHKKRIMLSMPVSVSYLFSGYVTYRCTIYKEKVTELEGLKALSLHDCHSSQYVINGWGLPNKEFFYRDVSVCLRADLPCLSDWLWPLNKIMNILKENGYFTKSRLGKPDYLQNLLNFKPLNLATLITLGTELLNQLDVSQ